MCKKNNEKIESVRIASLFSRYGVNFVKVTVNLVSIKSENELDEKENKTCTQ